MNNNKKYLLILVKFTCLLFICEYSTLYGQLETANWYFGGKAGITFLTPDKEPVLLGDGAMNTLEGCSTASDSVGQLLFYSDGTSIYNKKHEIMENGDNLYGSIYSTQSCLIIRKPLSSTLYYVFTTDAREGNNYGLRYSIVDISQNNGLGKVIEKNVLLNKSSTEKLTAVVHKNGTDIWIITHEWGNNTFGSYLLDSSGLISNPVLSKTGKTHSGDPWNYMGCMKVSPDGAYVALGIFLDGVFELFKFDNNSGILTDPITIQSDSYVGAYGVEFSSDCSKLYLSVDTWYSESSLYQLDLKAKTPEDIVNSAELIAKFSPRGGALQLALNGKIYHALQGHNYLGVINNPNEKGGNCNYDPKGVYLNNKTCHWGLPVFLQTYFKTCDSIYSAIISIKNIEAEVGCQDSICVYSFIPDSLVDTGYDILIKFDKSVLTIDSITNASIVEDYIEKNDRYLKITGIFHSAKDTNLFKIYGKILLASNKQTPICITDFTPYRKCTNPVTYDGNITADKCLFDLSHVKMNDAFNVHVYPNPVSEISCLNISGINKANYKIEIFNIQGQLIESYDFFKDRFIDKKFLDFSNYSCGTYHLNITFDNNTTQHKLITISR